MSLIQEALQRKQEEPNQPKPSLRLAPPPIPMEPLPASPPPRPGRSMFLVVILIVLLAVLAVSAFLLLRHLFFQKSDSESQAPETTVVAEPTTSTPDSAPAESEPVKREATSPFTEPKPPEPVPPPPPSVEPLATSPGTPRPAVDAALPTPPPLPPEPAAGPPEPRWPMLTLKAVMARTGSKRGTALLNGRLVSAGEDVDGVRVMEVREDGVLLGLEGRTHFLRVGQTLP